MKLNFFEQFDLPQPVGSGLVYKIVSPKGVRKPKEDGEGYAYRLKTELQQIYHGDSVEVEPGIYWVMDIHRYGGSMRWEHYLFIVDSKGARPVAEFLNAVNSDWVIDALEYVKAYYKNDKLRTVRLTSLKEEQPVKASWGKA